MARVAVVLAEDFEDSEFRVPYDRLRDAGHELVVVGRRAGQQVAGKKGRETVEIERAAADAHPADFDALLVPGGYSPDKLRLDADVVSLVNSIALAGKPVFAICHGPQLLIEADVVVGKTMTSWPSVRKDLENAGAKWVDREVCIDGNVITSRKPDDMQAFTAALLQRVGAASSA